MTSGDPGLKLPAPGEGGAPRRCPPPLIPAPRDPTVPPRAAPLTPRCARSARGETRRAVAAPSSGRRVRPGDAEAPPQRLQFPGLCEPGRASPLCARAHPAATAFRGRLARAPRASTAQSPRGARTHARGPWALSARWRARGGRPGAGTRLGGWVGGRSGTLEPLPGCKGQAGAPCALSALMRPRWCLGVPKCL